MKKGKNGRPFHIIQALFEHFSEVNCSAIIPKNVFVL